MIRLIVWSTLTTACLCAMLPDMEYNTYDMWHLDLVKDNPCDGSITLNIDESPMMVFSAAQTKGVCRVRFFIPNTNRCNKICTSLEKVQKPDIVVVEASDGMNGEPVQMVEGGTPTCFVDKMEIFVTVRRTVTETSKNNLNYTVNAVCPGVPMKVQEKGDMDAKDKNFSEKYAEIKTSNYIKGIVTGLCLALVFLIILFVTYCYYKNSSFRGTRDYPAPKSGPSLSGFKAKLHINKESKHKEKEAPRAEYRAKDSTPEHKPLLAGAAAVGTGEIVLREKGDDDDKKAPEIVVSGDSNEGGNNDD